RRPPLRRQCAPIVRAADRSTATRETRAYRAGGSRPRPPAKGLAEVVRQRRVEVLADPHPALPATRRPPSWHAHGDELGARAGGFGDEDLLAGRRRVDETGQLGFCVVEIVDLLRHGELVRPDQATVRVPGSQYESLDGGTRTLLRSRFPPPPLLRSRVDL